VSDRFLLKPVRPTVVLGAVIVVMLFSGIFSTIRGIKDAEESSNIILITVDTLRTDHMSTYGYFLNTTPELDRFAEGNTVFEQCMSTASQTVPAIASIMTSKYPSFHSAGTSNGLQAMLLEEATLARVFRENGYYCAAFVSNYVLSRKLQMFGGFHVYDDTFTSMEYARPFPERNAARTTEYAVNWLKSAANKKFFLWVHYQDPHGPYTPPEPYTNHFAEASYGDMAGKPSIAEGVDREKIPDYQYIDGNTSLPFYLSKYDAEIAYADQNIGKLLDYIRDLGLWEKSIIVFAADHGESMGEHGYFFQHGQDLTEELIHVPFIIHLPSMKQIERTDDLVSNIDIAPTILDAVGLKKDLETTGLSLVPLIRGETARLAREYVTAEDDHGRLCLRSRETKYVAGPDGERLYDLVIDRGEATNIVEEEPERAAPWRERGNAYRETIVLRRGDTVRYSREDIEKLKALGYVN
jgi:arylsulfatase A-like enzyme